MANPTPTPKPSDRPAPSANPGKKPDAMPGDGNADVLPGQHGNDKVGKQQDDKFKKN